MGLRGPKCGVCQRKDIEKINSMLLSGNHPVEQVALRFDVVRKTMYDHRKRCLLPAQEKAKAAEKSPPPRAPELPEGASPIVRVQADIQFLEKQREWLSKQERVDGKSISMLSAQLTSSRRLEAKLMGGEITSSQYARSPHFHRVWDSVVKVLEEKYPAALAEVEKVVRELAGIGEGEKI